jgi:hypothetical protein
LFIFKGPKSKLKLKISSNGFLKKILDIHMNEKTITCHDCHGFKWQNINIYPFLKKHSLYFDALFGLLDCDYTPTQHLCKPKSFQILGANYK